MRKPHGFGLWPLALLLALSPSLALAQQSAPAGVVTTLKGEASVARVSLTKPAPLNFRDDVFYRDRIMTERDSLVRVLLGGKALLTIRELSDFTIQEQENKATITLGFGRMALQVIKSLLRPGEEIEVRTPNAVAAIRGSFHFFDVTPNQTIIFNSSPTPMTSGGTTYTGGPGELFTFKPGVPPLQKLLGPNDIVAYSQQFLGGVPLLGGNKATPGSASLINSNQTSQAAALASTLSGQGGGNPLTDQGGTTPPTGLYNNPPPSTSNNYPNLPGQTLVGCTQNPGAAGCQGITPATPTTPTTPTIPNLPVGPIITLPGLDRWCDDCTTNVSFGFSFPFQGQSYTGGELSSNGFLSLVPNVNGQGCCNPLVSGFSTSFLGGAPRIALAWYDLYPVFTGPAGTVSYNTFPGYALVTFNSVPEFYSPTPTPGNTMQMLLLSDGRIVLSYPSVQAPTDHQSLIGVTPGGGVADPGSSNFSSFTTPHDTGTVGTVYQLFDPGSFVSSGKVIIFTPNAEGGWIVLDPPATDLAFYTLASGNVATLQSPLLNTATGQIVLGDVAWIQGQLVVSGSVGPLVSLTGGTHSLAVIPGSSIFDLAGSATATEVVEGNTLTLGTDRPIRGDSGGAPAPLTAPLLQASGASIGTDQVVRLDTALLEASAPLINLTAGSNLTSNRDVLNLAQNAKLTANLLPGDALFNVNGSVLNIYNGSLANVAGGSALRVNGNLLSLANGSTVNILSGFLVSISGGSVFSLTGGSLVSFGAGTNTLNIANNTALCAGCSITTSIPNLTGVPVLLANGATAANVTANPGFVPFSGVGGTNRVNVTGTSGAVLAVNGATSKVVLRP